MRSTDNKQPLDYRQRLKRKIVPYLYHKERGQAIVEGCLISTIVGLIVAAVLAYFLSLILNVSWILCFIIFAILVIIGNWQNLLKHKGVPKK